MRLLTRDWVTGRAVIDRTAVQVADLQSRETRFPQGVAYARQYGHRTTLQFLCFVKGLRSERS